MFIRNRLLFFATYRSKPLQKNQIVNNAESKKLNSNGVKRGKNMNKFKKLVPAICMLLVSAVLMGTSTFAWFSMNTSVTAKGMSVQASTDNAYLIIKEGTTLSGSEKEATGTMNATLKPVSVMTGVTLSSANIETVTSWGTGTSTDPNDANTTSTLTALSTGTTLLNTYVAKQSFMVGIVANSGTVANDLRLDSLTISNANAGITVVVVCGTNLYSHNANVTTGGTEKLADKTAVTTTGVQVDVYVYIDGKNANVKTANAVNLTGTVELVFSIAA